MSSRSLGLAAASVCAASLVGSGQSPADRSFALATAAGLRLHGVRASAATDLGQMAVRLGAPAQATGET